MFMYTCVWQWIVWNGSKCALTVVINRKEATQNVCATMWVDLKELSITSHDLSQQSVKHKNLKKKLQNKTPIDVSVKAGTPMRL